jgi:hypothetical protein
MKAALHAALQTAQAAHAAQLLTMRNFSIDFEQHPKPHDPFCSCFVHAHVPDFTGYINPFLPFVVRDAHSRAGIVPASYRPAWLKWCDDFLAEYTLTVQGQLLESEYLWHTALQAGLLHPIDLVVIGKKVSNWRAFHTGVSAVEAYTNPMQFANDIRLLVRNVMTSTSRFSKVFAAAMNLAAVFELQWCNLNPPARGSLTRFPQQYSPDHMLDLRMLCALSAPELVVWCTPLMLAEELVALSESSDGPTLRIEAFGSPPNIQPQPASVRQVSEPRKASRKRNRQQRRGSSSVAEAASGVDEDNLLRYQLQSKQPLSLGQLYRGQ